jgi:hypothetical protein
MILDEILEHVSVPTIVGGTVAVFALMKIANRINEERKIAALGGHGRRAATYAPFGKHLSFIPCPAFDDGWIFRMQHSR